MRVGVRFMLSLRRGAMVDKIGARYRTFGIAGVTASGRAGARMQELERLDVTNEKYLVINVY